MRWTSTFVVTGLMAAAGCSSTTNSGGEGCEPRSMLVCLGANDCVGEQRCGDDGSWGACVCGSEGGAPGTGGTTTGGATTGGATGTGGAPEGGTATGGATTGGATTGGATTGGAAEGGGGAGGAATGGTATGGATTGGATTGGAATGGTTTGGAAPGGATGEAGTAGVAGAGGASGAAGAGGAPGGTGGTGGASAPPSCAGMLGSECAGESCCTTARVPSEALAMGRSNDGPDAYGGNIDEQDTVDADPEHLVTTGDFLLDKYEVTVGRFRAFVSDAALTAAGTWAPAPGAGRNAGVESAHPTYDTGWQSAWDANLPTSSGAWDTALTPAPACTWNMAASEARAMNCVSWYEAQAFCIWDGGRLPTEAEWETAAAGGTQNRLYPWGSDTPTCTLATFGTCASGVAAVGTAQGEGRWGHRDLAGNVWEWAFDWYRSNWYGDPSASGTDVCNLTATNNRVIRGGNWDNNEFDLRAARRSSFSPTSRYYGLGFRCARSAY